MNHNAEIIKTYLDRRTMLEQLAEECTELAQASLKLIRAEGLSNNHTPITLEQADLNLKEEIQDVISVIKLLFPEDELNLDNIDEYPKYARWVERLKSKFYSQKSLYKYKS